VIEKILKHPGLDEALQARNHSPPTSLFDHSSRLFWHRATLLGSDSTWRSEKQIDRWGPVRWFIKAQQISTGSSVQTPISGTDLLGYRHKNRFNSTCTRAQNSWDPRPVDQCRWQIWC